MKSLRMLLLGIGLAALGACSTVPYGQRQAERLADYTAAAGAPVSSFRFFTPLWSWEPLSQTQLAVYTQPHQAYLLEIAGGCVNLPYTTSIGLTSNLHEVSVGFDKVLTGGHDIPCMITQIRPIDMKALKVKREQQRVIDAEPRETAGSPAAKPQQGAR